MEQEKRPGGLTALAVFNFIFAALGLIGFAGLAVMLGLGDAIPTEDMDPDQRAQMEAFQELGTPVFVLILAVMFVMMVLEIISGVGYLKQSRNMGWLVGNIYAVSSVVSSLALGNVMPKELGGGFGLTTLIDLVYPVITLVLLNLTFKEDFYPSKATGDLTV